MSLNHNTIVLQKRILNEFHSGHLGISRMKSLMRSYVYKTKMDQDIEKLVKVVLWQQNHTKNTKGYEVINRKNRLS